MTEEKRTTKAERLAEIERKEKELARQRKAIEQEEDVAETINAETNLSDERVLKLRVTEIMHEIGIPANIRGYNYIRDAIMISVNEPEVLQSVTRKLYPEVARKYNTTPSKVERCMRHAIEKAWEYGDVDTLYSYFGYTVSNYRGKPTNSEFISMIADKILLEIE